MKMMKNTDTFMTKMMIWIKRKRLSQHELSPFFVGEIPQGMFRAFQSLEIPNRRM